MRDKIFGITGLVISLLMLASAWNINRLFGSGAFESGQKAAMVIGGVMLVASIYTLYKKPNEPKN